MCFLLVSFVARNISDYLFVYLLILTAFFGPLAISKIPDDYLESLKNTLRTIGRNDGKPFTLRLFSFYDVVLRFKARSWI